MNTKNILTASVALNALLIGSAGYFWIGRSAPTNLPLSPVTSKSTAPASTTSAGALRTSGPFSFPAGANASASPSQPASVAAAAPTPAPVIAFPGRVAPIAAASNHPAPPIVDNASAGVPVEPSAPGNSLHFRGMRIAVAENLGTGPAGQPGLAVDITPEASAPGAASEATTQNGDFNDPTTAPLEGVSADQLPANRRASAARSSISSTSENDPTALSSSETVAVDQTTETPPRSRLQVFTPEENLFRARWGWAAFDLMRREANREASNRPTATN